MNNDEFKSHIASKTGIPEELLTGETPEENLSLAASLLAFKRDNVDAPRKSTSQQFADWVNSQTGEEPQSEISAVLSDLREAVNAARPTYPNIADGGEIANIPDPRTSREKFEEWANNAGFGLGSF